MVWIAWIDVTDNGYEETSHMAGIFSTREKADIAAEKYIRDLKKEIIKSGNDPADFKFEAYSLDYKIDKQTDVWTWW